MRARSSRPFLILAVAISLCGSSIAFARTGYYQFPDLHDHAIVFASEGVPDRSRKAFEKREP